MVPAIDGTACFMPRSSCSLFSVDDSGCGIVGKMVVTFTLTPGIPLKPAMNPGSTHNPLNPNA